MSRRNTPDQDLRALKLPEIWPDRSQGWPGRRQELVALLSEHVYGRMPSGHGPLETRVLSEDARAFAGKAVQQTVELAVELPGGRFSFPVQSIVPYAGRPAAGFPFFVHIAFRPDVPDKYLPAEEIVDAGFALLNFCYQDIAPDRDDQFAAGLPALYPAWMERRTAGARSRCGPGQRPACWTLLAWKRPGAGRWICGGRRSSAIRAWENRPLGRGERPALLAGDQQRLRLCRRGPGTGQVRRGCRGNHQPVRLLVRTPIRPLRRSAGGHAL
jgi:hypothetical protein